MDFCLGCVSCISYCVSGSAPLPDTAPLLGRKPCPTYCEHPVPKGGGPSLNKFKRAHPGHRQVTAHAVGGSCQGMLQE